MNPTKIATGQPIDAIVEYKSWLVVGSYVYDGNRSGKIQFIDQATKQIVREYSTPGTLCLFAKDAYIYAANTTGIAMYDENGLVKEVTTEHINTYIDCQSRVIASDTGGRIHFYSLDLEEIKSIKVSNDTIWVAKEIAGRVYIGTEEGYAYEYSFPDGKVRQIGDRRSGILDFMEISGWVYISSYDGNVEAFEVGIPERRRKIEGTTSLWKMVRKGPAIHCSCMYDGYRKLDLEFNLIESVPTESICYGMCVAGDTAYWSSFYENCIYHKEI